MSVYMTGLMEKKEDAREERLKINRTMKNLDKEINTLSICIRTNCKEVRANDPQQNLLDVVPSPAEAQAQFAEMGAQAAALAAEPDPLELSEEAKADRARVDGLNALAATAQAANGVTGTDGFEEATTEELGRQSGRKKNRKAA